MTQARARKISAQFKKHPVPGASFSQRRLTYESWAEKWKDDYQIQNLGKRFVIVPAWRKAEYAKTKEARRIPVWIDPLSAFGSGGHETTRLIVRVLEGFKGRFQSFLDVGVGTGILSVVAAHLGASSILGFDNDKPSAQCAELNFLENGFTRDRGDFKCIELAKFKLKSKFDIVCANINSHILENYRTQIVGAAKPGGWVLVSGILHQTYDSFREAFDGKDLRCLKILRGRRWVAVLYRKL